MCLAHFVTPGSEGDRTRFSDQGNSHLHGGIRQGIRDTDMLPFRRDLAPGEVRNFGLITLAGFLVIGSILWLKGVGWAFSAPLTWQGTGWQVTAVVLWLVGAAFAIICSASHALGLKLYVGWMTMAVYLGTVVSFIMLSLMFLILLPVFSLIRLGDPLRLKLKSSGSYWEDHAPDDPTLERMSRMF